MVVIVTRAAEAVRARDAVESIRMERVEVVMMPWTTRVAEERVRVIRVSPIAARVVVARNVRRLRLGDVLRARRIDDHGVAGRRDGLRRLSRWSGTSLRLIP